MVNYEGTPEHIKKIVSELFHYYYPIERDLRMPHQEKIQHIKQWWE
jgi:hypothetical protein